MSHRIEQILRQAGERVWIVTPYLKTNPRLRQMLEEVRNSVDVRIVCREQKMDPHESAWLDRHPNIRVMTCPELHAKCYMSESEAVIGSMNLYEHSQVRNYELGVGITRQQDPQLYQDTEREVRSILNASVTRQGHRAAPATARQPQGHQRPQMRNRQQSMAATREEATETIGFCIRCGSEKKYDPSKPYHPKCYRDAQKFGVIGKLITGGTEPFCHRCGKRTPTSLEYPLCWPCRRK